MPTDKKIDASSVNEAHINVLSAIADKGDPGEAQKTFNSQLAEMVSSANTMLAEEIEARSAAEVSLADAQKENEELKKSIDALNSEKETLSEDHAKALSEKDESIQSLEATIVSNEKSIKELEEANEKLSAETTPTPVDMKDEVEDEAVAPSRKKTGKELYEDTLSKVKKQASLN